MVRGCVESVKKTSLKLFRLASGTGECEPTAFEPMLARVETASNLLRAGVMELLLDVSTPQDKKSATQR